MLFVAINWTTVLVYGVPAYLAAIGAIIGAWRGTQNRNSLQTPSGENIGHVVERTHDLAAVTVAATTGTNGPAVDKAVDRLTADPNGPSGLDATTLGKQ